MGPSESGLAGRRQMPGATSTRSCPAFSNRSRTSTPSRPSTSAAMTSQLIRTSLSTKTVRTPEIPPGTRLCDTLVWRVAGHSMASPRRKHGRSDQLQGAGVTIPTGSTIASWLDPGTPTDVQLRPVRLVVMRLSPVGTNATSSGSVWRTTHTGHTQSGLLWMAMVLANPESAIAAPCSTSSGGNATDDGLPKCNKPCTNEARWARPVTCSRCLTKAFNIQCLDRLVAFPTKHPCHTPFRRGTATRLKSRQHERNNTVRSGIAIRMSEV
jgi:hypothetical protein